MRLFDVNRVQWWMREPDVNAIGTIGTTHFPMWVWRMPNGVLRFYDPDGREIPTPASCMFNGERAKEPPPAMRMAEHG